MTRKMTKLEQEALDRGGIPAAADFFREFGLQRSFEEMSREDVIRLMQMIVDGVSAEIGRHEPDTPHRA